MERSEHKLLCEFYCEVAEGNRSNPQRRLLRRHRCRSRPPRNDGVNHEGESFYKKSL